MTRLRRLLRRLPGRLRREPAAPAAKVRKPNPHKAFKKNQIAKAVHEPFGPAFGHDLEARFLHGYLSPGDVVIDVGANAGQYAAVIEDAVGRESLTLLEPLPDLAATLRQRFPGVRVENLAASDVAGAATIRIPSIEGREYNTRATLNDHTEPGQGGSREVAIVTEPLDSVVERLGLGRIDLVKVDVEGHEPEVVRGARRTLSAPDVLLLMEIEARHHDFPITEVFGLITALGLRGYVFDTSSLTVMSIDDFAVEKHQHVEDLVNRAFVKYLNNFWFVAPAREREFLEAAEAFLADLRTSR
ncbi:FkbM family methyltransferase [Marmoricola sp. OAE513]|uniref:FkbM family methyltransferase n=1 Tax=Marmoricola sp. OAE513 TaxID=2817894 RepID=UPI001AE77499